MRPDDPLFNIKFIRAIEKRPCIWNYKLVEYNKRNITEGAWAQVAEELNDSVQNCRERWRNLRGAFLRTLKQPQNDLKRKYYLNDYLQFLLPYTKCKTSSGSVKVLVDDENLEEQTSELENQSESQEFKTELPDWAEYDNEDGSDTQDESIILATKTDIRKRKYVQLAPSSDGDAYVEYLREEKERKTMDEDASLLFLRSLLPDMLKMTSKQNRRFRQKVLGLIDDVLEDADIARPGSSASTSTQPSIVSK